MKKKCKPNESISDLFEHGDYLVSMRSSLYICLLFLTLMMIGCAASGSMGRLADYDHPIVIETTNKIIAGETSNRGKLEKLFYYVRDDIHFGFSEKNNFMKASDVIEAKVGYCNNKTTLFLAMCKTADIPARVHFGEANLDFFRGIYPDFVQWVSPSTGSHGWIEAYIDGKWHQIDSYIIDQELFGSSLKKLKLEKIDMGYGIACQDEECGIDFDLNDKTFVQMGAVIEDHGVWEDPSEYFASEKYIEIGVVDHFFFKFLVGSINNNVDAIRKEK